MLRQMEPAANPGDSPVELELTVQNVESVSSNNQSLNAC